MRYSPKSGRRGTNLVSSDPIALATPLRGEPEFDELTATGCGIELQRVHIVQIQAFNTEWGGVASNFKVIECWWDLNRGARGSLLILILILISD